MRPSPADFWRGNADLRDITPHGERFPEVGLFDALRTACRGLVFEFGCGDGRLSPAFDPERYFGFDINPAAVTAAMVANPKHRYVTQWVAADTFLAHTVLLHVPDSELPAVLDKANRYPRIVIGEVMGRKWRRDGNPPVFNREAAEYEAMFERNVSRIEVPYPRYGCDLTMLVFE
jgi:hypothetical protein